MSIFNSYFGMNAKRVDGIDTSAKYVGASAYRE